MTDTLERERELQAIAESFFDPDDADDGGFDAWGDDAWEFIEAAVLSVEFTRTLSDPDPLRFTLVVGTGGPHIQFSVSGADSAWWETWGWFGADRAEIRVYDERYAELFDMLCEYVENSR